MFAVFKYYKTNITNTKQYILHQQVILYFKRVNLFNQCTVDTVLLII